jgi:protein-arginine kinase activator protein McsA
MPNIKENISRDLKYFETVHDAIVQYQKSNDKHESEILDHSEKITEIQKKIIFIKTVLNDLIKINNDKSELF